MLKGNALIGQSGGPTAVINASLVGLSDGCRAARGIRKIFGMRWGIEGVLRDTLVELSGIDARRGKQLASAPSSALGASRHKLNDVDFEPILRVLRKHEIRYLFMIGGNDTMDTVHRVTEHAKSMGYEM